jgi:hypothetical protein
VSQAIYVAATLRIADLLADGSRASDDIAAATDTNPDALYRLLRALATVGVLREEEGRRFALTPFGEPLRSDAPDSIHGWAALMGRPYYWQEWGALLHSVRTGENAARHVHGMSTWEYRAAHPEESEIFDAAMTSLTRRANAALLDAYDFGRFATVVDVAGGRGALLAALLARYPDMRGVLFDQQHVVTEAEVPDRCSVVAGSFFDGVPGGGDAYLLKWIVHDWEDEEAEAILRSCRRAIAPGGTLLVIERVVRPGPDAAEVAFADLNMLVAPGGRERTLDEFATLFARAGFRLEREVQTASGFSVLEATPK